jgi:glycosyltransferase involved in cell wall biosynthesis
MRLAVETSKLVHDHRGIGRYTRNLLQRFAGLEPDLRFTLFAKPTGVAALRSLVQTMPSLVSRTEVRSSWTVPWVRFDLFWSPWNYTKYLPRRGPIVVTMHDVAPLVFLRPKRPALPWRPRIVRRFRTMASAADLVLTDSAFVKTEVDRWLGIPAERVRVVFLAADGFAPGNPAEDLERVRRLGLNGRYLFFAGASERRKNLDRLVQALGLLRNRHGLDCSLVIAGPDNALESIGPGALSDPAVQGAVHFVGKVDEPTLHALYRCAAAFVMPSLYEGFGLPVLEAMACGTAVVSSSAASLPEVGGDAALYFDPMNVDEMAGQVARVLVDESLRRQLVDRGLKQAAKFSWDRTARETLAAFRDLLAGPRQWKRR